MGPGIWPRRVGAGPLHPAALAYPALASKSRQGSPTSELACSRTSQHHRVVRSWVSRALIPAGLLGLAGSSGIPACSLAEPNPTSTPRPGVGGSGGDDTASNAGTGGTRGLGVDVRPVLPGAGSGGSSQADASVPPSGDGGSIDLPQCDDCETIRITSGAQTELFGSPGGSLYMEVCPHDQVVVGMDYRFDFGTPADFGFLTSLAPVCGALVPSQSTGTIGVVVGEALTPRGAGAGTSGVGGRCPAGQVVTGFEGARNLDSNTSELRELTLHCAPLTFAEGGALQIGAATPAPPLSTNLAASAVPPDDVLPLQPCPAGQVVRGAVVRAGAWVDAVGLLCGAPSLAHPDGRACSSASECQSGRCSTTCQPRACTAPEGCSCVLRENAQYAVCEAAQTQNVASELCTASGMHLAHAIDPLAHGWLRATASDEGIQAEFWLGADDLASEGAYQWVAGGGAVDLESELWTNQQSGGTAENCLAMTRDGHWDDVNCALALPFVCEEPVR